MNRWMLLVLTSGFVLALGRTIPSTHDVKRQPKQDFIGGWIQGSEWFPIEINVPDTVSGIGQGLSNFGQIVSTGFMNLSDGFGNWIQGIPIINRITSQLKPPRPLKYFMLVPYRRRTSNEFNPYDGSVSNYVPFYP